MEEWYSNVAEEEEGSDSSARYENSNVDDDIFGAKERSYKSTSNFAWVLRILESVDTREESDEGYPPNFFYSPKLIDYFIRAFVGIPLWSNLLNETFRSSNYDPISESFQK